MTLRIVECLSFCKNCVNPTRNYPKEGRSPNEHDAYSVAAWLSENDRRGTLDYCFKPPLIQPDSRNARLAGWILGVC
jgi:hypothetical protein